MARINGKPASGLGIKLATGANTLYIATVIKAKLAELQPFFPQGMKVVYPYDTTPFVKISIHEVVKTLFETIILLFLVIYLLLQNIRNLIHTIAIPIPSCRIVRHFCDTRCRWLFHQYPDDVRHGTSDSAVDWRYDSSRRKRWTCDYIIKDTLSPREAMEKSMPQIQGRWWVSDSTVCGIYPDDLFWRLYQGNLSPVLYLLLFQQWCYPSCADSDTRAVRYTA